jgi:ABC-type transport system substrate-binding protein
MIRAALAVAALGATSVLATAVAHAESRPRYGGNIEVTLLGAPATLDPASARSHAEITVSGLVFDTLYRVGAGGGAEPMLAAGPPTLDASRTTVFVPIRAGVRMHDGSELTPGDVAQSLDRVRQQARWVLPGVLGVKADEGGVVLSLRAPIAELTMQLAQPQTGITKGGKAAGDRPIGSGPYAADAIDRGRKKLVLRAFDEHFAGRPYVDTLTLTWYDTPDGEARKFETGRAQVSARGATAFAGAKPAVRAVDLEGPAALLIYVGFGRAHRDITEDRAFRHALDLALARGGLAAINSGERVIPTRAPVPVEAGGTALDVKGRASDSEAARVQLAAAQRRVASLAAARLPSLRLEVLVEDTRPDDREIAERVVLALDKLGIGAVITALPAQALRDRVTNGTCDLWIGQLAEPVAFAQAWWAAAYAAGGDDWPIAQLQVGTLDVAAAAREFAARLPIVPLMFRSVRMWRPTNLRGLAFDASGRPGYADLFLFGTATPNKGKP